MNVKPPRLGEVIAGAAALVLLASLFLPWYGSDLASLTGWQSFAVVDLLLVIVAATGLALPALEATQRTPAVAVAWSAVTFLVAVVALALVGYRMLDLPSAAEGLALRPGALLALAAAAALVLGALLSMRDDRVHAGGGSTGTPDVVPLPPPTGEART